MSSVAISSDSPVRTRPVTEKTKASQLFELFGGVRPLARAIGLDDGGVSRWNKMEGRGKGGHVPPKYNRAVLEAGEDIGLPKSKVSKLLDWQCPCCGSKLSLEKTDESFWYERK